MFVYMLELPRKVNESAVSLYEESIMNMVAAYEEFKKCKFEREKLKEVVLSKKSEINNSNGGINVGIMGARCNDEIVKLVENSNGNIVFNITCTGDERVYDDINNDNFSINKYTECLLNKLPCVRMEDVNKRSEYIEKMRDKVQGIIYHTVKFCDIYSYEYAFLKDDIGIPLLKVETDYTKQCAGQIKTRVEAFIESLSVMNSGKAQNKSASLTLDGDKNNEVCRACYDQDGKADAEYKKRVQGLRDDLENESKSGIKDGKVKMNNGKVYVLGVDSGSTSTNAVIMDGDRNIVVSHVVRTGAKSKESARKVLDEVLEKANLKREDLSLIISTGYGRVSIDYADKGVTEISCHGRGAHYLNPEIRTIIDIGGQDSKVIKLNDKGEVTDFAMNDKCAAGTGRFLEMMARTLEINIKEMGPEALKWKEDISISSMCSVFAESEVISLIAENKEKCDIIHALCASIASKTNSLLNRVGRESKFMMTGGVAQNIGVVKAIEDKIGEELFISKEPEIVGAIGAALYALDELQ